MELANKKPAVLYFLNASLLITHEIDSAYWHEWTLFHLPGGIAVFLLINFFLICLIFLGYSQVVRAQSNTGIISSLLACVGILTFVIHLLFIMLGHAEFQTISSLSLLTAILIVSILQLHHVTSSKPDSKLHIRHADA